MKGKYTFCSIHVFTSEEYFFSIIGKTWNYPPMEIIYSPYVLSIHLPSMDKEDQWKIFSTWESSFNFRIADGSERKKQYWILSSAMYPGGLDEKSLLFLEKRSRASFGKYLKHKKININENGIKHVERYRRQSHSSDNNNEFKRNRCDTFVHWSCKIGWCCRLRTQKALLNYNWNALKLVWNTFG